jgi:lipopolysaccharide/colanic/teichoic acid biosynthesis glycosyltransferase
MRTATCEFDDVAMTPTARARMIDGYESLKPALDFALAIALILPAIPLMLLAMALVRLGSRGPLIYSQRRLGRGGKVFTMYKIRTMKPDCERDSGPVWSIPGDPRVTPIGRILRWSHLDELPQLVNILMGEMSLVGPRPERPELAAQLENDLADYRRRLAVRPGLTGLAQVQQASDTDLSSVCRKLDYDLLYIDRIGLWLDFRLLLGTALKCLGVPFATIGRILRLPDPDARALRESLARPPHLKPHAKPWFSRLSSTDGCEPGRLSSWAFREDRPDLSRASRQANGRLPIPSTTGRSRS